MGVDLILKGKVKSNLGTILDERGLRYNWVAKQIDATPSQVTNWCKNEDGIAKSTPSVLYILKLQNLLGVRVEDLFELVDE